jgi:GMP synthase-like glutamine amidotransferase
MAALDSRTPIGLDDADAMALASRHRLSAVILMNVYALQHVPFEGLGHIGSWLASRSLGAITCRPFESPEFPDPDRVDWLIILGGPMSVNEESVLSWLRPEKEFVEAVLRRHKTVLGICLGAQVIASALGARVYRHSTKEIGWHAVRTLPGFGGTPWEGVLPEVFSAFHWHGETFDLPEGALHLATSAACPHQAFAWGQRALALQFHLEMTVGGAADLARHCPEDLAPGPHVQSAAEFLDTPSRFAQSNVFMTSVLEHLFKLTEK